MNLLALILALPVIGGMILAMLPQWRLASWVNVGFSLATLIASIMLFVTPRPQGSLWLFIDDFNIYLVVLTAFVGFTTSIFSAGYIAREALHNRRIIIQVRFYHAMYQAFMFAMLLALSANNLGLMWVAVEAATLATVLMVSLYRTREAIEAAWKYFILCSVGIALALFGTILVYLAAQPVMGPGEEAMAFTEALKHSAKFHPALMSLAFVFLLVGYGTKVGLAPLHAWLPDAHAEGPTPISAVLSGLLLNVALYALLRFKMIMAANEAAISPGPLMVGMGISSLLLSSFMLYRTFDIKRLFAYSSIEHMGIITFAFGMGGMMSNFAGLMHMTMHSLAKSAVFFAVGFITQIYGSKKISDITGLGRNHPLLAGGFLIGVTCLAGLPPFGIFMSEFLVVSSTFARQPLLAIPLILGLILAFAALISKLQEIVMGKPGKMGEVKIIWVSYLPMIAHLVLVVIAGLYLPHALVGWFQNVARLLG